MGSIFKWKFSNKWICAPERDVLNFGWFLCIKLLSCTVRFFPAILNSFIHHLNRTTLQKNTYISVLQSGSLSLSLSLPDTTNVERVTGDSQAAQYSLYWTSTLFHLLIIHNYHSLFIFCSSYLYFLSCLFTSFFEYSNW